MAKASIGTCAPVTCSLLPKSMNSTSYLGAVCTEQAKQVIDPGSGAPLDGRAGSRSLAAAGGAKHRARQTTQ